MKKKGIALVERQYLFPFVLITSLFFLWGFAHAILDVLNKHFQATAHHHPYPFGHDSGHDVHGLFHHGHSGRIVHQPSRIP